MFYIVPTPIWNLEDITLRAIRILKEVDLIACEDTRTSGILLSRYEIDTAKVSYHSHSGQAKLDKIISKLKDGNDVALISDAGTPGISDPGYALVRACIDLDIEITALPGACAAVTALSASGLGSHHFLYLGFLPVKKWRQTLLKRISENKHETIVIYESVHRILKTLSDLQEYFWAEQEIVIAREISKKFEEYVRSDIQGARDYFENKPEKVKGEFVILL